MTTALFASIPGLVLMFLVIGGGIRRHELEEQDAMNAAIDKSR